MAKKLKDDEIKWILDVDSSKAQQGIHSLNKENKELEATNKSLRKSMNDLIAAGKKESDEYKKLDAEIKKNNKTISENKKKVDELEKSMGIEALTMAQLRKRAKELQTQLNHTSKATNPEAYAKLEKELGKVTNRINDLNGKNKQVNKSFSTIRGGLAVFLGGLGIKFTQFLGKAAQQAKEFVKQSIEIASKAEGVSTAFDKLNQPDLLKNLRQDTKGLISDFQLMQTAVKAQNFGIPFDNLGKLLKFAQQRAQETGESVDYLVDSIINGIGRKSPLILDNLGISASKLQEQVKKTGDFAGAAIEIVNEELEKQGDLALTSADKAQQASVKWENAQLAVGKRFKWLGDLWNNISGNIADSITKLAGDTRNASQVLDDQITKVSELEVNIRPLAERYDELSTKTELNSTEQEELNGIMNTLSDNIPGIVTKFDEYGNILSINTDKVYDYIEAEKARLQYTHRDAIKQAEKDIDEFSKKLDIAQKKYSTGYYEETITDRKHGETYTVRHAYSPEEMKQFEKEIQEYGQLILGAEEEIKELSGKTLEDQINAQKELIKHRQQFNAATKKELDEWIKNEANAANKHLELAKQIYEQRFGSGTNTPTDEEKKQAKEREKNLKKILADSQALIDAETKAYNDRLKAAGLFGKERNKLTMEELQEQLRIESDYQARLTEIAMEAEDNRFEKAKKDAGIDGDPEKLTAEQNKALEILTEQHEANKQKIRDDGAKKQVDMMKATDQAILRNIRTAGQQELQAISAVESAKIAALKAELADGIKTQTQYDQELKQIQNKALADRLKSQQDYLATLKLLTNPTDEQKKEIEQTEEAIRQTQNQINDGKITDEQTYQERRKAVRDQYGLTSLKESYELELKALKESLDNKLISEEEYQRARKGLQLKYAGEYIQEVQKIISAAADTINAIQEAQVARSQANYEKDFSALQEQLDNKTISQEEYNQKKEKLDYEQRKNELEIEKQFADAQFAIKSAEILAASALAVMNAWASAMTIPPPAGQIMAGVLTGLIGITTIAQIAAANEQRKAVKATTLEAPSTLSGSNVSGKVVMNDGFADGGFNHSEMSGYTGDGGRYEYAGTFANGKNVHKGEYIVAQPEMKNPALIPLVRRIEAVRRKRTNKNPLPNGFSDGGYNGTDVLPSGITQAETSLSESIGTFARAVDKFAITRVRGDWNMSEFKTANDEYNSSMNLGNR
ncbi:hypothetical protein D0T49_03955 [Paludibacter sp. 221]|uniref:hypothetical protein n=1 Tax=Paludibacter sp. 221 TaxID=2302939 RepID=UPI0013D849C0|nr:hypothetical protein [Paludibacter sp. 221]NDV46195.1 hypothetical protein [Paludibacter sp. 221]